MSHLCQEASRALASGGLEGGWLGASLLYRVHLWYCWYCWPYRDQLTAIGEAARARWGAPLPAERRRALEDRVLARLRRPS
ncbi:hypothetical protein EPO15_06385 [bacterium]|nr:MAG: hypothetical protein EPO15_06385 [bacterium]